MGPLSSAPGRRIRRARRDVRHHRRAGDAARLGPRLPRRQGPDHPRPRAHGDRSRLRRGGMGRDGADGLAGDGDPRGVRRRRVLQFFELGICSRRWVVPCSPLPRSFSPWCSVGQHDAAGRRREQKQAPSCPALRSGDERLARLPSSRRRAAWDPTGIELERHSGRRRRWCCSGTKSYVLDGHTADTLLVAARDDDGPSISTSCRPMPRGERPTRLETMDMTRKQAEVDLCRRPGARHGDRLGEAGVWRRDHLQRLYDLAVSRWPSSRSVVRRSAWRCRLSTPRSACSSDARSARSRRSSTSVPTCSLRSSRPSRRPTTPGGRRPSAIADFAVAAPLAKACCSDAYFDVAADTIQVHGGIGFTWEHDAHLYFKRAKTDQLLFGDPQTGGRRWQTDWASREYVARSRSQEPGARSLGARSQEPGDARLGRSRIVPPCGEFPRDCAANRSWPAA